MPQEANSKRAFDSLAEIAALSAERGECRAADVEQILSRARAGQVMLRRPFFFSLLKAACALSRGHSANRALIQGILAEMRASGIDPDQATISVLVDLISSESANEGASASDVWWVLEQAGGARSRAIAPRVWVPLMKILAAAAKRGAASSDDALLLLEKSREYFGLLATVPSIFLFNAALMVMVHEARFRTGSVPPGLRVRPDGGSAAQDVSPQVVPAGKGKTPWHVIALMDDAGVSPDAVTFNTALSFYVPASVGYMRDDARRQGLTLIQEMRSRDVRPTVSSYNTLTQIMAYSTLDGSPPDDALARAFSPSTTAALSLPCSSIALSPALASSPSASPSSAHASGARRAAAALAQVDQAMIRMRKQLLTPDAVSYDTLLNVAIAACKIRWIARVA